MELILTFFAIFLVCLLLFALIVTFGLMRRRKRQRVALDRGPHSP